MSESFLSCQNTKTAEKGIDEATILDKINGKPRPPLPPKSRMGKWRVFALRAPSSLIWGGWGFAVPFYFVQDCSFTASLPCKKKKLKEKQTNAIFHIYSTLFKDFTKVKQALDFIVFCSCRLIC